MKLHKLRSVVADHKSKNCHHRLGQSSLLIDQPEKKKNDRPEKKKKLVENQMLRS